MKTRKEPTTHELSNLSQIQKKQAEGLPLNFNERNILNILKRRKLPTVLQATVHFKPTPNNKPSLGMIQNKKTKNWKGWSAGQTININDFLFFELWLIMPDKTTKKPSPSMTNQIIMGQLKHGAKVKITL